MRILMLSPEFPPIGASLGHHCYYLLKALGQEEGVVLDFITASIEEEEPRIVVGKNITIHEIPAIPAGQHHATNTELIRWSYRARKTAIGLLAKNSYAAVHALGTYPAGVIACSICRGLPFILTIRDKELPSGKGRNSLFRSVIYMPLSRKVWRNAHRVICDNRESEKELSLYTQNISCIEQAADLSVFGTDYSVKPFLRLLCVAKLTKEKRIDELIMAVARLEQVDLTVIGTGPYEDELKSLSKRTGAWEQSTFLGYVPHERLKDYYQEADLFVCLTGEEKVAASIREAMASGLPLLLSGTRHHAELVNGNGILLWEVTANAIKKVLKNILSDKAQLLPMAKVSRKLAEEHSWEKVALEHVRVYKDAAERST